MNESSLLLFSNQLADVVSGIAPSVVQVQNRRRPVSGVVFADGLVVATARALGRNDEIRVRTDDGATHDGELAGWDPSTNLVVIKVKDLAVPVATPATDAPRVGQFAIAVARSWSNAVTATTGLVSVIGGPLPIGRGHSIDRVIRTDAAMHGGFSGGAFVDATGKVIGITTAAAIRGLGVVIPADIAWKSARSLADHGTPKRGYLGLAGQPVELPERHRTGDARTHAILVIGVSSGSPAESGGILVGDMIVSFDGHPVSSPVDLLELLHGERVGQDVNVQLVRGGVLTDLKVTIGDRSGR